MTETASSGLLGRIPSLIEGVLSFLVAAGLAFMTVVTFFDVLGRYFLASPVPAAFQLTEFAMGISVFAAIPIICWREQQIAVDLASGLFKGTLRRIRSSLINLICAVLMGVLAWRFLILGLRYAEMGDTTIMLGIPLAPFAFIMMAFSILATLALVARTYLHATGRASEAGSFGLL